VYLFALTTETGAVSPVSMDFNSATTCVFWFDDIDSSLGEVFEGVVQAVSMAMPASVAKRAT